MENKIRVSLSKDLRKKYGIRAFPIATGDIVTVRTGARKGEGGKVSKVDHRSGRISIDGITISKGDGKQEEYLLPANILRITRLELSSPGRLQKIKDLASRKNIVVEEEPPEPEPEAEVEETEEREEETGDEEEEAEESEKTKEEPQKEAEPEGESEDESEDEEPVEKEQESDEEVKKDD